MLNVPRLVVAAPASGSGKTTVAMGLMAAFTRSGVAVSPHKVGPDYIDPGYHGLAAGRRGRNLDAYLCGPERIAPLCAHGAAGAELAVVEGVMGLFDGVSGAGELASTAHVAKLLRAPVVLVVDASAQSRSVAALVHGFASWDPEVRIGGVILNKVGSARHEELLRDAMEGSGVPVLGALRRDAPLRTPSRHLGLVPAAERNAEARESVSAVGERVRAGCDLAALYALARTAPALPVTPWDPVAETRRAEPAARRGPAGRRPVVAVAGGAAFTFSYAEHAELLGAAGAEVVPFDPLRDEALPPGATGLVIGGGFPETYAPELSANRPLREAVAAFPGPVSAECAGLLYLARTLEPAENAPGEGPLAPARAGEPAASDGRTTREYRGRTANNAPSGGGWPMCGVLDATGRMTGRLTLGYREAVATTASALAPAGARVRGHEFHRTTVSPGAGADPAWGLVRPERRTEGFVRDLRAGVGRVHASYLHLHWAAAPELVTRFVEHCAP
ncbi:cobyrinate a,c-diamide synthase [Streptomyces sp. AJS327]|uniref:cobyrinate a,c-diamide synthase n=1 Tax=Streptomyces sp. AJS327 TaxID=2545265 RepID=UPI0015DF6906|nr:cobyrinate a,c-diamide synthase [Streptomyces sp. AJS327]MBA0050480.1 cobyrinate a,c-diamide synthase [Streptomyces sp. AJS327]